MDKLGIRDVTWGDLEEISKLDLMDDDKMELQGLGVTELSIELVSSCIASFGQVCKCYYELESKEIIGVYGISKFNTIWFLSSKRLMEHKKEFARRTKKEFNEFTKGYNNVFNFVHPRHKRANRWLQWLGLRREEMKFLMPPHNVEYYKYTLYKED